jgi:hypothetical protein
MIATENLGSTGHSPAETDVELNAVISKNCTSKEHVKIAAQTQHS